MLCSGDLVGRTLLWQSKHSTEPYRGKPDKQRFKIIIIIIALVKANFDFKVIGDPCDLSQQPLDSLLAGALASQ